MAGVDRANGTPSWSQSQPPLHDVFTNASQRKPNDSRITCDVPMIDSQRTSIFPSVRTILWDRRNIDDDIVLKPPTTVVSVSRETLLLCGSPLSETSSGFTLTSITTMGRDSTVCINISRFTPEKDAGPSVVLPESRKLFDPDETLVDVDLLYENHSCNEDDVLEAPSRRTSSFMLRCEDKSVLRGVDSVLRACQGLDTTSGATTDIGHLFWIHMLIDHSEKCSGAQTPRVLFTIVQPSTTFKATPVPRVPTVDSVLHRRTQGLCSRTSAVTGIDDDDMVSTEIKPDYGFLTMDSTRKVVLLHPQDPHVTTRPIIGVWVGPVCGGVRNPAAWAACVRFLHSAAVTDRCRVGDEAAFLLAVYTTGARSPSFYECTAQVDQPGGEGDATSFPWQANKDADHDTRKLPLAVLTAEVQLGAENITAGHIRISPQHAADILTGSQHPSEVQAEANSGTAWDATAEVGWMGDEDCIGGDSDVLDEADNEPLPARYPQPYPADGELPESPSDSFTSDDETNNHGDVFLHGVPQKGVALRPGAAVGSVPLNAQVASAEFQKVMTAARDMVRMLKCTEQPEETHVSGVHKAHSIGETDNTVCTTTGSTPWIVTRDRALQATVPEEVALLVHDLYDCLSRLVHPGGDGHGFVHDDGQCSDAAQLSKDTTSIASRTSDGPLGNISDTNDIASSPPSAQECASNTFTVGDIKAEEFKSVRALSENKTASLGPSFVHSIEITSFFADDDGDDTSTMESKSNDKDRVSTAADEICLRYARCHQTPCEEAEKEEGASGSKGDHSRGYEPVQLHQDNILSDHRVVTPVRDPEIQAIDSTVDSSSVACYSDDFVIPPPPGFDKKYNSRRSDPSSTNSEARTVGISNHTKGQDVPPEHHASVLSSTKSILGTVEVDEPMATIKYVSLALEDTAVDRQADVITQKYFTSAGIDENANTTAQVGNKHRTQNFLVDMDTSHIPRPQDVVPQNENQLAYEPLRTSQSSASHEQRRGAEERAGGMFQQGLSIPNSPISPVLLDASRIRALPKFS
eukprot:m.1020716 g.1020716  ORF g.1020716 m.1020716 type:complete len:1031 (-) comp24089_c0_seq3:83-3175(-)